MKRKVLTKTFMILIKTFGLHGLYKSISALQWLNQIISNKTHLRVNKLVTSRALISQIIHLSTFIMHFNTFTKTMETK